MWVVNGDNFVIVGVKTDLLDVWHLLSLKFLNDIDDVFVITLGFSALFFDYSLGVASSGSVDSTESFG